VRFARKFANLRYERGEKVKLRPQNTGSQPTGTRFRGNPFNIIFNLALNRLAVSASEAEKLAAEPIQKPCFCTQTSNSLVENIPELDRSRPLDDKNYLNFITRLKNEKNAIK